MNTTKLIISCIFLFQLSLSVYAIDWSKVEAKQITLFYPGQSSWEWILTKSDHGGAKNFRKGKDCRECHQGEEIDMGKLLVAGKRLEPTPIPNKRGFVDLVVKTAYDNQRFYIQLSWQETSEVAATKMTQDQTRVTFLFDDGQVNAITRAGCWATCHDDATNMPSAEAGTKRSLYLAKSRTKLTRQGGGENHKTAEQIQQLLNEGFFVEYWQAKLNQGKATQAIDAYILDSRHENTLPKISASAELINGTWVLEMSRDLISNFPHSKNIVEGKLYSFGVAIHDAFSAGRNHLVSFSHTFTLDQGKADFIAVKQ